VLFIASVIVSIRRSPRQSNHHFGQPRELNKCRNRHKKAQIKGWRSKKVEVINERR
jgi:hypothetical protein